MTGVAPANAVIEFRDVHKSFHGVEVLRGIDLSITEGETFTILGGSGSGKSVCLKHMVGLMRPGSGSVRVLGEELTELNERQLV
ncbi:MAG: ATP-binding cassette domain-containing protein, partial [Myxococcota bacterium]